MLQTIDEFRSGSALKTDVCIAGAGPAGIALALTLAELGVSSVLLEAGPPGTPVAGDDDPYRGLRTGLRYPLAGSRLRCFGGTSRHWGGWCKPLDDIDFDRRDGASLPSWPITPAELAPHYAAALRWCEIPSGNFDAKASVANPSADLLDLGPAGFSNRLFRFSPPTRFDQAYGDAIAASPSVRCICNAALNQLEFSGDNIRKALARGPEGRELSIAAERFVLATGGIEVARFLLHMKEEYDAPYAAESDLIGSGFMDHFGFHPGYLEAAASIKYFRHEQDDLPIMPVITAAEDLQRDQDLPSICLMATPDAPETDLPPAYFANPGILGSVAGETQRYRLQLICEPTAHRESRVTLANKRDAYGMRRLALNWQIRTEDFEDVERFLLDFERAVGMQGAGRVQRSRRFIEEYRVNLSVGMHHMGTTRMSDNPRFGVVDPDCRVYGSANLYVASSSVFPRVGYSNPTLAILAFVDRLASHFLESSR